MKRHQSLFPFSHHHHKALLLAQVLMKNAPPFKNLPNTPGKKKEYLFNEHFDLLKYHFDAEEQILFPFIKKITEELNPTIEQILSEHKIIFGLIEKARANYELETTLDVLSRTLKDHVRLEERILFENIQQKLSQAELAELESITSKIDSGNTCRI